MTAPRYGVAIAGAVPVGATLAIDLARRGVRTLLLERNAAPRRLPKMERCNARSMEIFRRLGLADSIRRASRFTDVAMDIFVLSDFSRPPLLHLRYPSVPEARKRIAACVDGSLPLEPQQLISQYTLEPLLRQAAQDAGAELRCGADVVSFTQDGDGVTVEFGLPGGATDTVRADWLVGCDGGVSTVRKQLGIPLQGRGRLRQMHQVFFRSEQLFERIPTGPGRHYNFPEGVIVVQDDLRHFMFNFQDWRPGQNAEERLRRLTAPLEVDIEILHEGDWRYHLLVAERYRDGRAFIAGDAAHLVIPNGGLGMNTGIGDAVDLAWKLAAVNAGWGGPALLDSYEAERREIGLRNRDASDIATQGVRLWRDAVGPAFRESTPAGDENRARVAALAAEGQPVVHELLGVELGYRYTRSPVIETAMKEQDSGIRSYVPSATGGARLPHMWRQDGSALHDAFGPGYTLLVLAARQPDTAAIELAMRRIGAPLQTLRMNEPQLRAVFGHDLLLVRPDLHVAWSGGALPEDASRLAATVTGHGPAAHGRS